MIINDISITNVRNHDQTETGFSGCLNIIHGQNGSGKTSILESIAIAGFSRSFMPGADATVVRHGENYYHVLVKATNELDVPYKVNVRYTAGGLGTNSKKQINSTAGDNLNPKDIIGVIPQVILSPDFKNITFGSPENRRQFIDRVLSQASRRYYEELLTLKKVLKQRNSLLNQAKTDRYFDTSTIEHWTEMMVKTSTEIVFRRNNFVRDFIPYFREYFSFVSDKVEDSTLEYKPDGFADAVFELKKEDIQTQFVTLFKNSLSEEIRRGTTIIGPQKDELVIRLFTSDGNSGIAKETASQGQHKSLLIGIKFAEFAFLKSTNLETPIILLDDIFSELDRARTLKVLEMLAASKAQTFITVTEPESLYDYIRAHLTDNFSIFRIEKGKVL